MSKLEIVPNTDDDGRDLTTPPHSDQAEVAVLGSIFKNPLSITAVSGFLTADDFYRVRHKHIFRAMLSLLVDQQPIDYHTTGDRLERQGTYEQAGGLLYLSEISLSTPTATHIEHYGRIVERTSVMRQLISNAQSIAELAYRDNLDADDALGKAQQLILSVSAKRQTGGFRTIDVVLSEYMDQIGALQNGDVSKRGVLSGYIDLDKLLGGFQHSDLILLAARPSVGKTALAMGLAANAASKYQARVAIFSLEMSADQLAARLLSLDSGVESNRIRGGSLNEFEVGRLDVAMNALAVMPLWIDDTPGLSIIELCNRARRLALSSGLDMIVIDYLQLISSSNSGKNRVEEVDAISKALKNLARELDVPVIALCQLSRASESRVDHTPLLSDLRESGSLEQNADVVMFIYRDEKYNPDTDRKGVADIIVAKHRNGPTGQIQLLFLERITKFCDLEIYRS